MLESIGEELREELKVSQGAEHFLGLPIRHLNHFWNALKFGFPSRSMYVIGVVGIEDTTAATEFIQHILFTLKKNSGSFTKSAVKFNDQRKERGGAKVSNKDLQQFLTDQKKRHADYAIIQLTPEDIRREIYLHINFDMVVASGLSAEEASGEFPSESEYLGALQLFLKHVADARRKFGIKKVLLVNLEYFQKIKKNQLIDSFDLYGYALSPKDMTDFPVLSVSNYETQVHSTAFTLNGVSMNTRLLGKSGLSYTMAGLAVVSALHYSFEEALPAFQTFVAAPGQFEYIQHKHKFDVIVDAAQSAQEVARVLMLAKSLQEEKRIAMLICVIGVSGIEHDPDIKKKAALVADVCNRIFITVDDSYDKNPDVLLDTFIDGFPEEVKKRQSVIMYRRVLDRKQAIEEAVLMARPQDIVLILGKINDHWIIGKGRQKISWDERKIIQDVIQQAIERDSRRYIHQSGGDSLGMGF